MTIPNLQKSTASTVYTVYHHQSPPPKIQNTHHRSCSCQCQLVRVSCSCRPWPRGADGGGGGRGRGRPPGVAGGRGWPPRGTGPTGWPRSSSGPPAWPAAPSAAGWRSPGPTWPGRRPPRSCSPTGENENRGRRAAARAAAKGVVAGVWLAWWPEWWLLVAVAGKAGAAGVDSCWPPWWRRPSPVRRGPPQCDPPGLWPRRRHSRRGGRHAASSARGPSCASRRTPAA